MYTTLITPTELRELQNHAAPLQLFDCSFELTNPDAGEAQFNEAHIPGALHAHLDHHLSSQSPDDRASGGRHPLPSRETFAAWLDRIGLAADTQAVVYDRQGANYSGRLWWMLKWCGHEAVAVLDGIPGALNRPFVDNIGADGCFKPAAQLRAEFTQLLAGRDPASVVHHCGSGVSAIPNLLGMEIAGLGRSALYAGSWSEWCNTPGLPCARSQVSGG
jgi:3-mercaptopyruvate sulfurtransferase SseA